MTRKPATRRTPQTDSRPWPSPALLARLLRIDRYREARRPPGFSEAEFERAWWLLSGRVELARGTRISADDMHWLLKPVSGWPEVAGLTMTRALWFAWHTRSELQAQYPLKNSTAHTSPAPQNATDAVRSAPEFVDLLCWFVSDGLRELQLAVDLPDAWVQALNAAAPPALWRHAAAPAEAPPLIMAAALRTRTELHPVFQLNTLTGQQAAWLWFFTAGAQRMGLTPLLANEWLQWCQTPAPTGPCGLDLPRLAYLKWQVDRQFRNSHPLTDFAQHASALSAFNTLLNTEADWQWHLKTREARTADWLAHYGTRTVYPPPVATVGVNLIGFAKGELGIGEDIRTAARSLDAAGIPYSIINIAPGRDVRQSDTTLAHLLNDDEPPRAPYPVNVFCLTGFDTVRVHLQQGPSLFEGRYNIGWWPWELPVWPAAWQVAFDLVDEVWAATRFNETMYRAATSRPVHRVPLSFHLAPPKPRSRRSFGLPQKAFVFLYIFDGNSYLKRKNPLAAVHAFQAAFPADAKDTVALVFKTMNTKADNPEWQAFVTACANDERIHVLNETLDKADVHALIHTCDAYVSLHRSEGYGRTLAEALLLGKPVIATDWSGNVDFLTTQTGFPVKGQLVDVQTGDYPFVGATDAARWCDADIATAAKQMRKAMQTVHEKPGQIAAMTARARAIFSEAPQVLAERLRMISPPRSSQNVALLKTGIPPA